MPSRTRARRHAPAPISRSLKGLGERLRRARVEAGLSQAQLGAPHFTRAYVSALELGKIRPAMRSIEFLAEKLGRSVGYFVEDEAKDRRIRERELALTRAGQLISEGSGKDAIALLSALDLEGASVADRLAVKRLLGRAYLEAGQPSGAAATLGECLRAFEAMGDQESVARTRVQLAVALIGLLSYAEAEEHLQEALRASASGVVRDPLFRVHALHNLGLTFYHRAKYSQALEHFERAAQEGKDVADQKWLASLYAAMGMSRHQVGDYEGAITYLLRSETLFESLHNRYRLGEIRFQTARTLRALGNKARAAAVAQDALALAVAAGNEPLAIRVEVFIGLTEAEEGRRSEAVRRLERLEERVSGLDNPKARFAVRFGLAKVLMDADARRAGNVLKSLATELERGGASEELGDVLDELSKALSRQGRAEEALAYARRAYAIGQKAKGAG